MPVNWASESNFPRKIVKNNNAINTPIQTMIYSSRNRRFITNRVNKTNSAQQKNSARYSIRSVFSGSISGQSDV